MLLRRAINIIIGSWRVIFAMKMKVEDWLREYALKSTSKDVFESFKDSIESIFCQKSLFLYY